MSRDELHTLDHDGQPAHEAAKPIHPWEQMLTIVSHELRTPLTSIIGYAELLDRRLAREEHRDLAEKRAVQAILEQSRLLNRLVSAVLDVSRIRNGQLRFDCALVDLQAMARRVVDDFSALAGKVLIDLSNSTHPLYVEGDELYLELVVRNLVQNAIKYSPRGGRIQVQILEGDDNVTVSVSDQGIGIPTKARAQLFQRSFRAGSAEQSRIHGFGIGLYLVQEIVEQHGGEVHVSSEEGKGSVFTVNLPSHRNVRHRKRKTGLSVIHVEESFSNA